MLIDKYNKKKTPKKQRVVVENIPSALKEIDTWVCWKWFWDNKKWTKPPCDEFGDTINHLASKISFKEAYQAYLDDDSIAGIGFSLRKEDKFCGIDFDDVIKYKNGKEKFNKRLKKCLKLLEGTYIERSPSGLGIRVFGIGKPKTRGSKGAREIEIYNSGRYLTITGNKVGNSKRLINITKQCKKIDKKIYKEEKSLSKKRERSLSTHENQDPNLKRLRELLYKVDQDSRDSWKDAGMIIKYETNNSQAGYDLWHGWSMMSASDNYDPQSCKTVWDSFKKAHAKDNPLTIATLVRMGQNESPGDDFDGNFKISSHKKIENLKVDKVNNILSPWFMKGSINMVHARRGLGKTHFCLGLSLALAAGGRFLKWKAKEPKCVLYIDGEMPIALLKEFLQTQKKATGLDPKKENLHFITIDQQKDGYFPSLSTEAGQYMVEKAIDFIRPDVIIFDSLYTLFKIDESAGNYWGGIQDWLLKLRNNGIDMMLVHHDNKSGKAQSGKEDKEACLSAVIHLQEPKGNEDGANGARFQLSFTKGRHFYGDDKKPFEARLERNKNCSTWLVKGSGETTREKIIEYVKEGHDLNDITNALGLTKPAISKHIKNSLEEGSLKETDIKWRRRRRCTKK